jgi:hypothetical protein
MLNLLPLSLFPPSSSTLHPPSLSYHLIDRSKFGEEPFILNYVGL